jgi:hypothetical protein
VERSLDSLADQLKRVNQDSSAEYRITDTAAFGDFLSGRARVQAADVGIRLEPRNPAAHHPHWAGERRRQKPSDSEVIDQLRPDATQSLPTDLVSENNEMSLE